MGLCVVLQVLQVFGRIYPDLVHIKGIFGSFGGFWRVITKIDLKKLKQLIQAMLAHEGFCTVRRRAT